MLRPKGRAWYDAETASGELRSGHQRHDAAARDGDERDRQRRQAARADPRRSGSPTGAATTVRESSIHVRREVVPPGRRPHGRRDADGRDRGRAAPAVEAAIPGFRVAGKTSTAQKVDPATGKYSTEKYTAVFVGFVPVEQPRIVVAVVLDEPMIGHYGGDLAGPVFRRVAEASLRYLGVTPSAERGQDRDGEARGRPRRRHPRHDEAASTSPGATRRLVERRPGPLPPGSVRVPDATGLPAHDVVRRADQGRARAPASRGGGEPCGRARRRARPLPRERRARGVRARVMMGVHGAQPRAGSALDELARELPEASDVVGDAAVRVRGVRHDSRAVQPGDLFVARTGRAGRRRALRGGRAWRAAPSAVMAARGSRRRAGGAVPRRRRRRPRARPSAYAASAVYGHPSFSLEVVGITGTNGKTTTAHLVRAAIDGALGGRICGILGTVGHSFGAWRVAAEHTTPEADDVARAMAAMRARGATHVAMEVSSHALAARPRARRALPRRRAHEPDAGPPRLPRLDAGVRRRQGAPLHGARVRARRSSTSTTRSAASWRRGCRRRSCASALRVRSRRRHRARSRPASTRRASRRGCARPAARCSSRRGSSGRTTSRTSWSRWASRMPWTSTLPARPRRCRASRARRGASSGATDVDDDVTVLVDYAHTPDALARALDAVRAATRGRVWCVFGCGGDRDADQARAHGRGRRQAEPTSPIVTSDNPQDRGPRRHRRARSSPAFAPPARSPRSRARPPEGHRPRRAFCFPGGDIVLIAGKGHEDYQIVGTMKHPFDDRIEARRALRGPASRSEELLRRWRRPSAPTKRPLDARMVAPRRRGASPYVPRRRTRRPAASRPTAAPSCPEARSSRCAARRHDGHDFLRVGHRGGAALLVVAPGTSTPPTPASRRRRGRRHARGLGRHRSRRTCRRWRPRDPARRVVAHHRERGQDHDEGALRRAPARPWRVATRPPGT